MRRRTAGVSRLVVLTTRRCPRRGWSAPEHVVPRFPLPAPLGKRRISAVTTSGHGLSATLVSAPTCTPLAQGNDTFRAGHPAAESSPPARFVANLRRRPKLPNKLVPARLPRPLHVRAHCEREILMRTGYRGRVPCGESGLSFLSRPRLGTAAWPSHASAARAEVAIPPPSGVQLILGCNSQPSLRHAK
jgi:hypothetical protein